MNRKKVFYAILFIFASFIILNGISCKKKDKSTNKKTEILVFVPGNKSSDSVYETMIEGVELYCNAKKEEIDYTILEAGNNQPQWEKKLIDSISSKHYDIVVSSSPLLGNIFERAANSYPKIKFILTNCLLSTYKFPSNLYIAHIDVEEEYRILGYLAALITKEKKSGNTIAFIASHRYQDLSSVAKEFENSFENVIKDGKVLIRYTGSWEDIKIAYDTVSDINRNGCKIYVLNCGPSYKGALSALDRSSAIVLYANKDIYKESRNVYGCIVLKHKDLIYELLEKNFLGKLPYGKIENYGYKDGVFEFAKTQEYTARVSKSVQKSMDEYLNKL